VPVLIRHRAAMSPAQYDESAPQLVAMLKKQPGFLLPSPPRAVSTRTRRVATRAGTLCRTAGAGRSTADLMHDRVSLEQQTAGVLGSELLTSFALVPRRTS
jgi:hypothetical protein